MTISDNCITCGNKKDKFSLEWEYAECESCSMIEFVKDK